MSDHESLERLVKGDKGDKGERGEGMASGTRRAIVGLFVLGVAIGAVSLLFTGHAVNTDNRNWHQAVATDNEHWHQAVAADDAHWRQALAETQRKFCGVVGGVTAVPVARPADPKANPSRETAWEWYERFVKLGKNLSC